ncbi:DNA-directed RNA polymerase subunit beta [Salinibacillus kushneri]|uniref:DNA-directed RNA polymerase subunit beta n=1 Tax=Salinibacillus kushneri TaxID=237682 RepID=A0A1I0CZJ7_9BACI|nr:DNA-directed RNA polymerase subunit beta [Salinibacillus kushneri]SET25301.1 DNA-directed RNA polymerase subunit beta [Salinibacillus kushneri]
MVTEQKKNRTMSREKAKKEEEKETKQDKKRKPNAKNAEKRSKKPRKRIFPIWLRIIVIAILCAVSLGLGLMIGYGVIGNGQPSDAFDTSTWQHIIDIVSQE